jgi:hypothetical protein
MSLLQFAAAALPDLCASSARLSCFAISFDRFSLLLLRNGAVCRARQYNIAGRLF